MRWDSLWRVTMEREHSRVQTRLLRLFEVVCFLLSLGVSFLVLLFLFVLFSIAIILQKLYLPNLTCLNQSMSLSVQHILLAPAIDYFNFNLSV